MGSDEYSSIQETREAPRLTAQQQLNKRERERRRRTAQAFENIRELLGVLGYECPNREQPRVLSLVQQALLTEAVDKGFISHSSVPANNGNPGVGAPSAKSRKRTRTDENTASRTSASLTLGEYAFSNSTLVQVIVGEDCRIVETNKAFRYHFHPKDLDVGDSILHLFSATNHAILEHSISTVLNKSKNRMKGVPSKPFDGILECHAILAGKFPNGDSPPKVKCTVSGICMNSTHYVQLSIALEASSLTNSSTSGASPPNKVDRKSDNGVTSPVESRAYSAVDWNYVTSKKSASQSHSFCRLYGSKGMSMPSSMPIEQTEGSKPAAGNNVQPAPNIFQPRENSKCIDETNTVSADKNSQQRIINTGEGAQLPMRTTPAAYGPTQLVYPGFAPPQSTSTSGVNTAQAPFPNYVQGVPHGYPIEYTAAMMGQYFQMFPGNFGYPGYPSQPTGR